MTLSLEFMPYSAVSHRVVRYGDEVLAAVAAPNLDVLVDALHLARSGGPPTDLRLLDPRRIGVVQLCDAPAAGPPPKQLRDESVNRRLYPGDGQLPLDALLEALPSGIVIEIECPTVEHAVCNQSSNARGFVRRAQYRRFLDDRRSRTSRPLRTRGQR